MKEKELITVEDNNNIKINKVKRNPYGIQSIDLDVYTFAEYGDEEPQPNALIRIKSSDNDLGLELLSLTIQFIRNIGTKNIEFTSLSCMSNTGHNETILDVTLKFNTPMNRSAFKNEIEKFVRLIDPPIKPLMTIIKYVKTNNI